MIFVRSSCLTWDHNGNTCMQYPSQWKSSLRTFYGRHHHLFYPKSVEVITKKILWSSSSFVLPPSQWKSSLRKFYGRHHHLFYPKSVEVITKNMLWSSSSFDFFFPLSPTIFSEEELLTLREHMVSLLSSVWRSPFFSSFCLFLTCSPMLSVSRDFTRSQVLDGVRVTHRL